MDFGFTQQRLRSRAILFILSLRAVRQESAKACRMVRMWHALAVVSDIDRAGGHGLGLSLILIAVAVPSLYNWRQKTERKCPNWLLQCSTSLVVWRRFLGYNAHIELGNVAERLE